MNRKRIAAMLCALLVAALSVGPAGAATPKPYPTPNPQPGPPPSPTQPPVPTPTPTPTPKPPSEDLATVLVSFQTGLKALLPHGWLG